ncbi:MAG: DUF2784 domain-containing protein [Gemmatimonadales bacterium]
MIYRLAADIVVLIHVALVVFVMLGALLVLRWPRVLWLHVPAVVWGATIEFLYWTCPLTLLESHLRVLGGQDGYSGGFFEHYLFLYFSPPGITRATLGASVVLVNVVLYWLVRRRTGLGAATAK